jgi:chromate reductase
VAGPCRVLLICGSLRSKSTNAAVLRTAKHVAPPDVAATVYDGLATLPHFNPDDDVDPLPPAVAELRAAIRGADALCFSTPEYAGALPGTFKNLLDWMIGDDHAGSIYEKPVSWINTSPRGAAEAHRSLRIVLGYAHARVVDSACAAIPVRTADIGEAGFIMDLALRAEIANVLTRLAENIDG